MGEGYFVIVQFEKESNKIPVICVHSTQQYSEYVSC